jgi:hypothetical protein
VRGLIESRCSDGGAAWCLEDNLYCFRPTLGSGWEADSMAEDSEDSIGAVAVESGRNLIALSAAGGLQHGSTPHEEGDYVLISQDCTGAASLAVDTVPNAFVCRASYRYRFTHRPQPTAQAALPTFVVILTRAADPCMKTPGQRPHGSPLTL